MTMIIGNIADKHILTGKVAKSKDLKHANFFHKMLKLGKLPSEWPQNLIYRFTYIGIKSKKKKKQNIESIIQYVQILHIYNVCLVCRKAKLKFVKMQLFLL